MTLNIWVNVFIESIRDINQIKGKSYLGRLFLSGDSDRDHPQYIISLAAISTEFLLSQLQDTMRTPLL